MLSQAIYRLTSSVFLVAVVAIGATSAPALQAQEPSPTEVPDLADDSDATEVPPPEADGAIDTVENADDAPCDVCTCTPTKRCQGCRRCGHKKCEPRLKGVPPYKTLFYDNDFGYLRKPTYDQWWPADTLKMNCLGNCLAWDVGGQYRTRYHGERNMRGLGLTGVDDDFLLQRTRIFGDVRYGKRIRFYAEYIDAVSGYENFGPRPIEENRSDMLNLFVDGLLLDTNRGELSARVGRQEVLYGLQRAVSPLDWANTRRTFDGAKLMWQGKNWDIDGFWLRPLRRSFRHFDNPNLDQQFYGIYGSYKGFCKDKLETYWLAFDNDATGARYDSLGGRYYGGADNWLVELWGNYQFGTNADNSSHNAGAITAGVGRKFQGAWKPTLWLYYDYASGDKELGAGNGYFQFFPLAHKYLGFMDFFGRRNIESPNLQFSVQPTEKLKLLAWYYYMFLENKNDTPYNVNMTPFAPGVQPDSADLGQEIDLAAWYKFNPRTGMLFGYSHFFSGNYYETPGVPYDGDADFFYTQFHVDF